MQRWPEGNVGFLEERRERAWEVPTGGRGSFASAGHYVGKGRSPLEVAIARAPRAPNVGDVRNLWKRRKGNTPSPLLLIVLWQGPAGDRAAVCGPSGDEPTVYPDRDPEQIARIARLALDEPDHHAARRLVDAYLPEEGGVRNHSLFATHHLLDRVPERPDWDVLCHESLALLPLRREELIEALGFSLEPNGQAVLLRVEGNARAMALFLGDSENPEAVSTRFNGMTPVSWAIARATSDNIPYVIVERGDQLRIHASRKDATRRAGAFVELNLPLLTAADAGYLKLLFSANSLRDGGELERLLNESHDFALGLGDRLRNRVYDQAVPTIAKALIRRHKTEQGATDQASLNALYNQTLLILFRLLFVAYSEDRGLLPLQSNDLYRQRSLKHLARELASLADQSGTGQIDFDQYSTDHWDNVRALWAAIDRGRNEWNVPPYNGGLFSTDADINPDGAVLAELSFTNAEFGPCLFGLLVDKGEDGFGPVDFASLDVREFGTIYEGLLESDLAVAPCNLTLNSDDIYVPAKPNDDVVVAESQVYLHNKSGARKSSGSYFTKPFAVQHLLEHALEPALDEHISRLHTLVAETDDLAAAEAFFDFRCVDLSMGSGHFLVAAVDHIERRLSEFLAEHRLAGVLDELDRLGRKSAENLAAVGLTSDEADTSSLLRRQIVRRCIYGVDLNPTSVELARLALWIHTFVKGLPLTSLDHALVAGNSLTGIGTLDEVVKVLDPGATETHPSLISSQLESALDSARESLIRFAAIGEADKSEVKLARDAHKEARERTSVAKGLCDLAVAIRIGEAKRPSALTEGEFVAAAEASDATEIADSLGALHFPIAFPEVFMRERPGFDCIVGNPPWEKLHVEEHGFWSLRFPGLRSMPVAPMNAEIQTLRSERPDLVAEYEREIESSDRMRHALISGPFPDLGTSHPDLYKAFAWRFWQLVRNRGCLGVVLPRVAMSGAGMATWRLAVLETGDFLEITLLVNNRCWVFADVHPQWTVALVSVMRTGEPDGEIAVHGPYHSLAAYQSGVTKDPVVLPASGLKRWSAGASLPLIPTSEAASVFLKMQRHAPLDSESDGLVLVVCQRHGTT